MSTTYQELYAQAERNTQNLGLTVPTLATAPTRLITQERGMALMARIGDFNPELRNPWAFALLHMTNPTAGFQDRLRPSSWRPCIRL